MCVGGVLLRLTGAKNSVLPTARRSLWALPLSLTRAEGESDGVKGRGSNCGDVRKREGNGEREREPVRENKQDRGCSVCQVSGEFQNVLHRCENSWRVICSWRCHLSSVRRSRATSLASAVDTRAHTSTDMQTDVSGEHTYGCARRMKTHSTVHG